MTTEITSKSKPSTPFGYWGIDRVGNLQRNAKNTKPDYSRKLPETLIQDLDSYHAGKITYDPKWETILIRGESNPPLTVTRAELVSTGHLFVAVMSMWEKGFTYEEGRAFALRAIAVRGFVIPHKPGKDGLFSRVINAWLALLGKV